MTISEAQAVYGDVPMTRKAGFVLVHLDKQPAKVRTLRTRQFDPDKFFVHDCPLCRATRAQGVIVYDAIDNAAVSQ